MKWTNTLCVTVITLLLTTMRISAHHAFAAEYDVNKPVSISGTVTEFKWTNPHAWLYVEATHEEGRSSAGASKWEVRAVLCAEDGRGRS